MPPLAQRSCLPAGIGTVLNDTMRNRALALAARAIPYIRELREITKGVTSTILMQQLEHWFNTSPEGFYKFLSPCNHSLCKGGESWTEELGFSEDEFRLAFDRIGVRYQSKKAYDLATVEGVIFIKVEREGEKEGEHEEAFYASYHDKIRGLTFYFRNHELVDAKIDEIFVRRSSTETGKAKLRKSAKSSYVTGESQSTELGNAELRNQANPRPRAGETQATELGKVGAEYRTKKTTEKNKEEGEREDAETETLSGILPILLSAYKNIAKDHVSQQQLSCQCQQIEEDGATTEEVQEWLGARRSLPPVRFIAEDFRTWRESVRRERASQKAKSHVGSDAAFRPVSEILPVKSELIKRSGNWGKVLAILDELLPPSPIRTWFEPLREIRADGGVLYLAADDPVFQEMIERNYANEFQQAVKRAGFSEVVIAEGTVEEFQEAA